MARGKLGGRTRDAAGVGVVQGSRYFQEIQDCLRSGWTPEAVYAVLRQRWGPLAKLPSIRTLRYYRHKYVPTAAVLPHRFIVEKLRGLDYKVDLLVMLSRLLPLLENRVAAALELEEKQLTGMPVDATDKAVATFLQASSRWWSVAADLGLVPRPPAPAITVNEETKMLVLDPTTAKELAAYAHGVLERVRAGEPVGLAEGKPA